jgi:hypothetical protein
VTGVDEPAYPQTGLDGTEATRRDPRVVLAVQLLQQRPVVTFRLGWPDLIWWLVLGAALAFAVAEKLGWHRHGWLRWGAGSVVVGYGGWYLIRSERQVGLMRRWLTATRQQIEAHAPAGVQHPGGWWLFSWHDEVQFCFDPEPDQHNEVAWRRWRVFLRVGHRRVALWRGRRHWHP